MKSGITTRALTSKRSLLMIYLLNVPGGDMKRPVFIAAAAVFVTILGLASVGCKPDPVPKIVLIEGLNLDVSVSMFRVTGRIQNQGGGKAMYTRVKIYIRDAAGNILAYNWNYCDDTTLEAGETAGFEVLFWDEDGKLRDKMDFSKSTYEFAYD